MKFNLEKESGVKKTNSYHSIHYCLAALFSLVFFISGCSQSILTSRTEDEANIALATLTRSGIRAKKVENGRNSFNVEVRSGDIDLAVSVLSAANLPRAEEPGLAELFPEPGLVSSPAEERARYQLAVSGDLSGSLRRLEGVRDARVHLGMPENNNRRTARKPEPPPKASVLLLVEPEKLQSIESKKILIKQLVSGGVIGLETEAVTVFITQAKPLPSRPEPEFLESTEQEKPVMMFAGMSSLVTGICLLLFIGIRKRTNRKEDES